MQGDMNAELLHFSVTHHCLTGNKPNFQNTTQYFLIKTSAFITFKTLNYDLTQKFTFESVSWKCQHLCYFYYKARSYYISLLTQISSGNLGSLKQHAFSLHWYLWTMCDIFFMEEWSAWLFNTLAAGLIQAVRKKQLIRMWLCGWISPLLFALATRRKSQKTWQV